MTDSTLPLTTAAADKSAERRRSQRVQIVMHVLVRGVSAGQKFEEDASTVMVNANGCMLMLKTAVVKAQQVSLVNPATTEELPCRVVFLGRRAEGKTEVGLEFAEASPLFWRINFPPEDWNAAERKRPDAPSHRPPLPRPPSPAPAKK
jgi:hypothetical protein